VHRGDKVTWVINSLHDIHFEQEPAPLLVAPTVDGKPLPQINPAVAFRTLDNGADYKGGEANSGLPLKPEDTVYSLIMDLDPGTYSYFCDVHPGMVGVINVVSDDTAIPTAPEATLQGSMELRSTIASAQVVGAQLEAQTPQHGQVQVGNGDTGRATINQFFPLVTEIKAGESVTFTIPKSSVEPHTVSWPPSRGQDVVPVPVEGGPPMLTLGSTIAPMTESGAKIGAGDAFSSGLYEPGGAFTLTFSEPGIYSFTCNIHPGMNGIVVVSA
jgi:plastocyanin